MDGRIRDASTPISAPSTALAADLGSLAQSGLIPAVHFGVLSAMVMLLSGRVSLFNTPDGLGIPPEKVVESGAVFAQVSNSARLVTAAATEDSRVLTLNWVRIQRLATNYPRISAVCFSNLAGIIGDKFREMTSLADNPTGPAQALLSLSYPSSYQALCDRLGLCEGIPYTQHWSAGADFLTLIVEHCLQSRPGVIMECSSGLTTVMLARCCQLNGLGRVYSLENGEAYARATRQALNHYGLGQLATVIHAPLQTVSVSDQSFQWYATTGIPEADIDMLVIDGPSGFLQRHSRFPAIPMLMDSFSDRCLVYLDDAARKDEREIITRWQEKEGIIRHQFINTERGCSILHFERG